MNPLLETAGVLFLALMGTALGIWFSKLPKFYWSVGYAIPLFFVLLIGLSRRFIALEFIPPISWLVAGRTEFALAALMALMLFVTPLSRLTKIRDKIATLLIMVFSVVQFSILPFLAPAWNQRTLAEIQTKMDRDGICLQSTDYNCGPAAAVTALRTIGIEAEEGGLAMIARTTWVSGTPPDVLAQTLQSHFAQQGVRCEYRRFESISELKGNEPVIALVKFSFLLDHYVVVLDVTDEHVIVGDPMSGKENLTHQEFRDRWRYCGITVNLASALD